MPYLALLGDIWALSRDNCLYFNDLIITHFYAYW